MNKAISSATTLAIVVDPALTKFKYIYSCLDQVTAEFPLVETVYVSRHIAAKNAVNTWARKLGIDCQIGDVVVGFIGDPAEEKAVCWFPTLDDNKALELAKSLALSAGCEFWAVTGQGRNQHR